MAKYRHRIFEMFEFRDETISALKPKTERPATESATPEPWTFKHLDVSRSAGVTHVTFKESQTAAEEVVGSFAREFVELAEGLGRDSRVVLDFTGVTSFDAASIDVLVRFKQKLQIRGSRIALCCLDPAVRESFFASRSAPPQVSRSKLADKR